MEASKQYKPSLMPPQPGGGPPILGAVDRLRTTIDGLYAEFERLAHRVEPLIDHSRTQAADDSVPPQSHPVHSASDRVEHLARAMSRLTDAIDI